MGESRDAVKAATEIGVIMMGRPVQNNHRHSVIAVTFRGSRPRVDMTLDKIEKQLTQEQLTQTVSAKLPRHVSVRTLQKALALRRKRNGLA